MRNAFRIITLSRILCKQDSPFLGRKMFVSIPLGKVRPAEFLTLRAAPVSPFYFKFWFDTAVVSNI